MTMQQVITRDGRLEPWDPRRIRKAMAKAFRACGQDAEAPELGLDSLVAQVEKLLLSASPAGCAEIEDIQDLVETTLMQRGHFDVARAFILYRARRHAVRDTRALLLDIDATMDGYLERSDWRVNENANVNFSLGGLILHNSGTITANYWLQNVYSTAVADAHRNADMHIHDLSMFSGYCAGWSLRQLIEEGLGGVPDKITSKPARHLSTLVHQMVNFLGIMQNEWAGAQAFSSFDTYLAPFVKIDSLDDRAIRQSLQSFVFGVNTPSRWGSQAPFTNITLDWTVPRDLAQRPALVGGREQNFTYGDCQPEMDRINRIFIELMLEGDANGRGFQYPIPTYNITTDFAWDSPNARLLFEMTGRYGTPYFQNFINSDLDPGDVRSMCCRLQLDKRELRKRGGGLFGSDEFTGSIGVVTVNLPRIGYTSETEEQFFARLAEVMDLAAESLTVKRKVVTRLMDSGLFPYTRRYLSHLNNHFSTIGLVGMHEALLNLTGTGIETEAGRALAVRVLDFMRDRLAAYQEETGDLFNLEASPAESTSYRLARHDRERFPDIITSGAQEPYYTNSSQLPVDATRNPFEALDHQDTLQTRYTGGTVFHTFLGEAITDPSTTAALVRSIAENYHLPYFTITPTFSICSEHGYLAGEHRSCPTCGQPTEIYTRIVGYYRSLVNWNKGKAQEYTERRTFDPGTGMKPAGPVSREAGTPGESPSERGAAIAPASVGVARRLYFQQEHCPGCRTMSAELDRLGIVVESVAVDHGEGFRLAEQHLITRTPTLLDLDEHGVEIRRTSEPGAIAELVG